MNVESLRNSDSVEPLDEMDPELRIDHIQPGQCIFCLRVLKNGTTEHHLIPRRCHRNRWFQKRYTREKMQETVPACRDCHKTIHQLVPREKELGKHYNTVSSLLNHPGFSKFVGWVQRQK